jgi:MFS superfamily sulfate permease-like transporter
VRRHYAPRDLVLAWDAGGHLTTIPPSPGAHSEPGLVIYRFAVGLFYANAGRLAEEVQRLVDVPDPPRWFVLDAGAIDDLDFTGAKTLAEVVDQLTDRDIVFAVAEADPNFRQELDRFGITAKIGSERYFDTVAAARDAFRAASKQ